MDKVMSDCEMPRWLVWAKRVETWLNYQTAQWSIGLLPIDANTELRSTKVFGLTFYYRVACYDPKKRADRLRCHEAALRANAKMKAGVEK